MDRKKRLILFKSVLGVLILLGLYVVAVEHLGSYTVTTVGEGDNLVNWSKQNEDETFNFTIPFSASLTENVTQVWITINDAGGYFDFATNASNSSILMNTFGGNAYEGANYSCALKGSYLVFLCENTSALHEFIQGSTLYFEVNVTANGTGDTTLSVDNATAIQFNLSTLDVASNWNETWLYLGIDEAAPIIYDINVTDGNRTLMNGTEYVNLSWNTALDGTDNNLSKSDITVTVLVQDPNIKNMTLYYTGTDEELLMASKMGNNTFGNGTAVTMTPVAVTHIGGDSGNLTDAGIINTHLIFTGTIPSTGLNEGNITTFVIVAADHYGQERVENNTMVGADDMFAFKVVDATAQVNFKTLNVTDYKDPTNSILRNSLSAGIGLDGSDDYLRAELNQFQVDLKNAATSYGGDRNVTLYYNTSATIAIDSNGTVSGYFTSIQLSNVSETLYNGSVNFGGNDTNTIQFAVEIMDSTSGYSSILGPYSYVADGAVPAEPTLTVPSDTTKGISDATGITYSCTSSDVTSGGLTYTWTLTKPSGATVTADGSSATFRNTDINEAGTYSVKCTATDTVGYTSDHTSTSTEDFSVTYSSGSTSSGGGGGGGSSGSAASFDVDFTKSTQGTVSIAQGSSRTFTFDGTTTHTVKVNKVEGDIVTMTLTSEPVILALNVGESKKVDLNGDSVNDVKVTLNSITNSVADITIEKIDEGAKIVQQQEVEQRAAEEAGEQPAEAEEVMPEEITKKTGLAIWITILVIIVIAVVAYFTIKKKKK